MFQTDIHPAAVFGKGIFLDHATGLAVGATSVIDDDVSILQNVTLGGSGNETGDRHPKVRRGVMIGAGAKILGNIEIGACSLIAAGSVVLQPVPPNTTMAGVPARAVGTAGCGEPSRTMNQILSQLAMIPSPIQFEVRPSIGCPYDAKIGHACRAAPGLPIFHADHSPGVVFGARPRSWSDNIVNARAPTVTFYACPAGRKKARSD